MWFETIVSFEKTLDDGKRKNVKEKNLVDAMSCTEAEARTIQEVSLYITGDLKVESTKEVTYTDVILNEKDFFFEARLEFITLDEKTGVEKSQKFKTIIQADDFDEAKEIMDGYLKGFMADVHVCGLIETKVVNVFTFKAPEKDA